LIQPLRRYLEKGLTGTTVTQEASAPSVDEMRTLVLPEWAMEVSTAKSALGLQVMGVQPSGRFSRTSSKDGLAMTGWAWAVFE
jgi:hypothetical protein